MAIFRMSPARNNGTFMISMFSLHEFDCDDTTNLRRGCDSPMSAVQLIVLCLFILSGFAGECIQKYYS